MDKSRRPITFPKGVNTLLWCLLFCAPLGIWSILYFANARDSERYINKPIEEAMDCKTLPCALKHFENVKAYLKKEGLHHGGTYAFYRKVSNSVRDVKRWKSECEGKQDKFCSVSSNLVWEKLKRRFISDKNSIKVPEGISLAPYYMHYLILGIIFSLLAFICCLFTILERHAY